MKTIIIYDSVYGNTGKIAKVLADSIKNSKLVKANTASIEEIKKADCIIVGSPTHGGWYTESIKKILSEVQTGELEGKKAVAFSTATSKDKEGAFIKFIINMFGYATSKITKALEQKGAQVIEQETFMVQGKEGPLKDGELKRAQKWAEKINIKSR